MIITCPNCSSRYHVDGSAFAPEGRKVRCANCSHRWLAKPPADAPTVVAEEPAPSFRRTRAAAESTSAKLTEPSRSGKGWIGASFGGMLVVLLLLSAIVGRNEIASALPASIPVFRTLGMPLDVELGLEFVDVKSDWQVEGGATVLVVEGQIVNLSRSSREIPKVRLAILDAKGDELQYELLAPQVAEIEAGTQAPFTGRLINPTDKGQNFRLSFELNS